jgi:DNA replication and repair protein RecF
MPIRSLTIRNFRIHQKLDISLKEGITVFTGANGSGKTSILEAISVLLTSRSFRLMNSPDLIRNGENNAQLKIRVHEEGFEDDISMEISEKNRKVLLNGKTIARRREIAEKVPFVVFSPGDHSIIDGDASDRRFFLDRAISNYDFDYADSLRAFTSVLKQRNALLKKNQKNGFVEKVWKETEVWNDKFIEYGSELIRRRANYLQSISPYYEKQYNFIAQSKENLELIYIICGQKKILENELNIENHLRNLLIDNREKDMFLGTTSSGPHRDDFSLTMNGNKVKFYGSQGEKRSAALALRLAEVEMYRQKRRKDPVLLMDDVSSELDANRRRVLVELLSRGESQVLITSTELPTPLLEKIGARYEQMDLKKQE